MIGGLSLDLDTLFKKKRFQENRNREALASVRAAVAIRQSIEKHLTPRVSFYEFEIRDPKALSYSVDAMQTDAWLTQAVEINQVASNRFRARWRTL